MTYFQVGSLTIPAVWIAAAGALIMAALLNRAVTGEKVGDWYWNGFFYYFISWKLSYIVFNIKPFLDMPMSILYFNGGTKGHALALVILSIYLLTYSSKRFPFLYEESARLFLLYFISYQVMVGLLEKSSLEMFIHLVILSGVLLMHLLQKKISNQTFLLLVLLELLIISWFASIFSMEALTVIWMASTTIFIHGIQADKGVKCLE